MITVITPTGGRQDCINLLAKYLNNQSAAGFRWLLVDDCDKATIIPPMRGDIEVSVIRPRWRWRPGMVTLGDSLSLALELCESEKVLICEDDDCYLPDYVRLMGSYLDSWAMVGERVARYYNIQTRRFREIPSTRHASLCATGFRRSVIPDAIKSCRERHIDIDLWGKVKGMLVETGCVVGIKGMPGRGGIGIGHRDDFGESDTGSVLHDWIGEYAAEYRWHRRK